MADFVADDVAHFVVGELVHEARVNADGAVGHGEGVDVGGKVDLEVHLQAVIRAQAGGEFGQARCVGAACGGDAVLAVAFGGHLVKGRLHFFVGQRLGFGQVLACVQHLAQVELGPHGDTALTPEARVTSVNNLRRSIEGSLSLSVVEFVCSLFLSNRLQALALMCVEI